MVQIKIYPSKHKIQLINESKFDTDLNIPLSYINLDYTKYNITKEIHPDFLKADTNKNITMTPILPNELIEDIDRMVFNKFEESVDPRRLYKKIGANYYYTPMYEFIPNKFSYSVTIKKNMAYNSINRYNINIGCLDQTEDYSLCSKLSKIFVDPKASNLVPVNISINNNKKALESLINMSYDEADFLFMKTHDGQWLDEEHTNDAGISGFLDSNVNVWVGCDDHYLYRIESDLGYSSFNTLGSYQEFKIKRPILTTNNAVTANAFFDLNKTDFRSSINKKLYNIFEDSSSPVLIIEHVGRGFEIISHNDVIDNPEKHKDLIFEVMMYVFLMSYKKSKKVDEWISYTVPNYEVVNNSLYEKTNFASHKSLVDLFDLAPENYSIYQIDIYDNNSELPIPDDDLTSTIDNITYTDVINNRIIFKMNNKDSVNLYTEVEKPVGWVSIYKDGKIYYVEQILYYIESDISNKLFLTEESTPAADVSTLSDEDVTLKIKLYPFKSSKYNINSKIDSNLVITNIKTNVNGIMRIINEDYIIYYDKETLSLDYMYEDEFEKENNPKKIEIFKLTIRQSTDDVFLTDMRQLGGGLRKDIKDDYDLLDIGHIDGRPYRKGNTLIITMPKKYESHKDKILEVLDKYKVGEDYSIVFFEDKDK